MSQFAFAGVIVSFAVAIGSVATAAPGVPQLYQLLPDSTLRQDVCVGPCACPPHFYENAMRGSFFLTADHSDPLFDYYRMTEINWVADLTPGPIHVTGSGLYRIGGEVALVQQLELNLTIDLFEEFGAHADSGVVPVGAPFPWISIAATTDIYICYQTTFRLSARPNFCPEDLNHNGAVELEDLTTLLSNFGAHEGAVHEQGDLDGDADVDLSDLARLLSRFGHPCPP